MKEHTRMSDHSYVISVIRHSGGKTTSETTGKQGSKQTNKLANYQTDKTNKQTTKYKQIYK